MKKRILIAIPILLFSLIITASAQSEQKTIHINKACQSVPGLTMTRVTITEDSTMIDFEWENTERDWEMSIYNPDHESAFCIKDLRTSRTYRLLRAEGVAYYPESVNIQKGEITRFRLVFDKMPYAHVGLLENMAKLAVSVDYQ